MKAPEGTRKNHLNQGPHRSLAAQHEKTRLADPEDISGTGNPGTHEPLKRVHENSGGHKGTMDGSLGRGHVVERHDCDAEPIETDIMDKD